MSDADFQSQASKQGREFEQLVEFTLKAAGWTIDATKATAGGAEIDIVATDPAGTQWWIECKGSHRGKVPGARRGDTAKKAVGVAAYLSTLPDRRPYRLITSHLPKEGTIAHRMLRAAEAQGWFTKIDVIGFAGFDGPAEDIGEDD